LAPAGLSIASRAAASSMIHAVYFLPSLKRIDCASPWEAPARIVRPRASSAGCRSDIPRSIVRVSGIHFHRALATVYAGEFVESAGYLLTIRIRKTFE